MVIFFFCDNIFSFVSGSVCFPDLTVLHSDNFCTPRSVIRVRDGSDLNPGLLPQYFWTIIEVYILESSKKKLVKIPNKESPLPTSVVGPNTQNLDPDPEFWPNLDPQMLRFVIHFFNVQTVLVEKHFSFFNYKKIMAPEENISQLSMNFVFNLTPFASNVSQQQLYMWILIRIHKDADYGSSLNQDPDPQQCFLYYIHIKMFTSCLV